MKIAWIRRHALLSSFVLLLLTLFSEPVGAVAAVALAGGVLAWALFVNNNYARALGRRDRSPERAAGDRSAAKAFAVASLPPLVYGGAALCIDRLQFFPDVLGTGQRLVAATVTAFALCFVFASTITDWYYIRPRRDGVVDKPPWQREERERWVDTTRWWILHRTLAATAFFVALWLVIGLGWFEASRAWQSNDWVLFLLALGSPPLIAAVLMRNWVPELPTAWGLSFGNLPLALGDWVEYHAGQERVQGFLYDVSVDNGYRVVDHDLDTHYLPLSRSKEVRGSRPPRPACRTTCEMVETLCEFRRTRTIPTRGRVLVL
jgi:hypothetical protein